MTAQLQAHRIETTLTQDGTLTLDHLPFHAGEAVEVIVLPHPDAAQAERPGQSRYPLRGIPIHYEALMDPVASDDWNALQ